MKIFAAIPHLLLASTLAVTAFRTHAGSIARLVYDGIPGTSVNALTNAPIFPDQPSFREQLDDYTPTAAGTLVKGLQSKENSGSNFGSYIRGYLEAPASGDYVFFVASDDASELWLSSTSSAANRRKIAFESSTGTALFTGARLTERQSAPVSLVRGQKYYLEVLHQQGTGASYVQVGWRRPDGTQEIIPGRHLAQHPLDTYLGRNEPNLAPIFNDAGFNGGNLLSTTSVKEGEDLVVELDVLAAQPTTIEWRRNGVVIPGENLSFLKLSRVSAAANGHTIQAQVANAYGQISSTLTTLRVTPDTIAPTAVAVEHRGNPNAVTLLLSEAVAVSTATDLANFELKTSDGTSLPVQAAVLAEDGRSIRLSGAFNFVVNGQYQLLVRNLADLAATPNPIAPNPTTLAINFTGEFIGPVALDPAQPLQNQVVLENRIARFEARLVGAKPWYYQWSRNGVLIPGATNGILEVVANAANVGGYQVDVHNEFSAAISPIVQLAIAPDTAPARLVSLRGLAGVNTVRLTFDEALAASSATNPLNYAVNGAKVLKATLNADGRAVTLQTDALIQGQNYLVSFIGLRDISKAGNPALGTASFVAEGDYSGEVLADAPVRYWRFNETTGTTVASLAKGLDTLAAGVGTLVNGPGLGSPSLLPGVRDDGALRLTAASNQRVTVPNGSDLNATAGPWSQRTIEFWFQAASVPAPDTTGLAATAGIWEEGAAARNIAVYLWRDPANTNPLEASLIFHALNNASDGPGAPFGLTTLPAVIARHTVVVGQVYHVVAVLDGDKTGLTGSLVLYVNGAEVDRSGGVGQVYNHTGDVQIGRGNGLIHTGESGDLGFFDGVLDEVAIYNRALPAARVGIHFQAGLGSQGSNNQGPGIVRAETRGNPNRVLATFSTPLAAASAGIIDNYTLKSSGTTLPISRVELLPGGLTVALDGPFQFQTGLTYTLTARDLVDQNSPPRGLSPNPSTATFQVTQDGTVGIGANSDLASRRAEENSLVHLKVVPTGTAPFAFQWFRNGSALVGEIQSELVFKATGATVGEYTVEVRNDFSAVTSAAAQLTLNLDVEPPRLENLRALAGSLNEVRLSFDEPIEVASGTNVANYGIDSVAVLAASLDATGRQLTLRTGPLVSGQRYTVTVREVKDRAAAGNRISLSQTVEATVSYVDELIADRPVRYWRLEETNGVVASSLTTTLDSTGVSAGTFVNAPQLGVPGLVPNVASGRAVELTAGKSQRLTVPSGLDLNSTVGPWAKRTVQFWFRANSVPAPGTTGLSATAGLWEEGGANRSLAVYLWRDPSNASSKEAELVLHAVNNVADGPGSPYGPPANPAVYTQARIAVGQTYHVVAVFDGDTTGLSGRLILYLNGVESGRATGVGQLYNHTSDIQIGRGNALTHTNDNGDFGFFDGIIDEVSVFNSALNVDRIAQLYQIGQTAAVIQETSQITGIKVENGNLVVRWVGAGRLAFSDTLNGTYVPVGSTTNPYLEPAGSSVQRFFRLLP